MKVAGSCPTLCDPIDYTVHGILQARILEWVAVPFPRDLLNPGIEPRSPTLQADSLPAEPQGNPRILEWVAYPFSSGSSWPRNWSRASCIASGFFTNWAIRETPKRNGIQMQRGLINQRIREEPSALASWVSFRDWWGVEEKASCSCGWSERVCERHCHLMISVFCSLPLSLLPSVYLWSIMAGRESVS